MNENMVKNNESGVVQPNQEGQQEKMFTQEQVNEIVRKRLERQKEDSQDLETRTKELEAREAEFTKKEKKFSCKEYLRDKGYPDDLLDIIDTSDVDTFKTKADHACSVLMNSEQLVAPLASTESHFSNTSAFPTDTSHTPKGYWPTDPIRAD